MKIKVFELEFNMFDAVEWKSITVNITAISKIQLMRTFITETRYIQCISDVKTIWNDAKKDIHEDILSFPIVSRK